MPNRKFIAAMVHLGGGGGGGGADADRAGENGCIQKKWVLLELFELKK